VGLRLLIVMPDDRLYRLLREAECNMANLTAFLS
jgi:hypothetical protein